MQKIPVWMFVPPVVPCASVVFCAFMHCPVPSYWQMYFSCPEYGKLGQNLIEAPDDPRMIPVFSLNGMEAFSWQNMLANTIEFHSICCPRKDDAHLVFFSCLISF
jgi:hypothetical protein